MHLLQQHLSLAANLKMHIRNKNKAKNDETALYEKGITSPNSISSDNITPDKENMDFCESGDKDNSTDSESGDDDSSTESSTNTSTTEDVWDDMI